VDLARTGGLRQRSVTWLLAGLVVLALVLRFWRLGDWNFQATEMFTLRDSTGPQFGNPRPLGYVLNYYIVRPFIPLDEFGLRLLPAVFGVLSIIAVFLVARRLFGIRAALFSSLILTVSPLHVMYSQLARYWALVFLLCAIYPYAVFVGIRDRNAGMLALGFVTGVLAALAHPVSLLLVGGPVLVFLLPYLRPSSLRELWTYPVFRWSAAVTVLLAIMVAVRFVPILQGWITLHDRNPGSSQFLLWRAPPGLKQVFYVLAYLDSLTLPVVLLAVLALYLLLQEDRRPLALYLISLVAFPLVFLTLLSLRTPVSQYYLLPTVPVFFITAGVFLAWLSRLEVRPFGRWVLPATVTTLVIATGLPTLLSDYRDGRRFNFRQVAHWMNARLEPGDVVYSDQHMVLAHYLPHAEVRKLRGTAPLAEEVRRQKENPGRRTLWVVAPAPAHAFRANLRQGGLIDWIYAHCELRNMVGVGRVDVRQHYLQVYRCGPEPDPRETSS
jgi:hypothetical protein